MGDARYDTHFNRSVQGVVELGCPLNFCKGIAREVKG